MNEVDVAARSFMIVSGGQTGADRAALDWAIINGVRHGGWCPKGRKAEDGSISDRYRLTETKSGSYIRRTEWNVRDSDVTLVFSLSAELDGGSFRTAQIARRLGKPWIHAHPGVDVASILQFLLQHAPSTVNVAGKRESVAPGVAAFTFSVLEQTWSGLGHR